MRFNIEGAGKGDSIRDFDKQRYAENYESIFGRRELPREFKRIRIVYCEEPKKSNAPFVPNQTEIFNLGLGCRCANNAMATEKMAKRLGLIPIGDQKIPDKPTGEEIFKGSTFKTLAEGYRKARNLGSV